VVADTFGGVTPALDRARGAIHGPSIIGQAFPPSAQAGAQDRPHRVADLAPAAAVDSNQAWQAQQGADHD
jgi:hypothetical protein